jgi:hypothetical protein
MKLGGSGSIEEIDEMLITAIDATQAQLEAVSKRLRNSRVRGWAAEADRDSWGLQHLSRDLDVDPDHPAAT